METNNGMPLAERPLQVLGEQHVLALPSKYEFQAKPAHQ